MKLIITYAQALSLVAVALAAPQTFQQAAGGTVPFPPQSQQPKALSFEQAVGLVSPAGGNIISSSQTPAQTNGGISTSAGCRRNIFRKWGTLSATEKGNFVGAIRCLTQRPPRGVWSGARSRYDELVWVHAQMTPRVHGLDLFLPWHRYYLFAFRTLLSQECGYNGAIPWWRETNNAGNIAASDIFSPQYFGSLPPATGGGGQCLNDGAFAGLTSRINNQCVSRGEVKSESNQVSVQNENLCQQASSFPQHRACVESTNHARMHRGIGPTMANAAMSPSDPVFFLHHSYVDWQWKRWQNAASSRWTTISGCADFNSPCTPLRRKTVLTSLGLIKNMRLGKFLDTEGNRLCYTYDEF
ncbi:uncharacterized protein B0I36DRAFT_250047 [Microdochium trichocladiopsis]|uniref:Tyrosinase copper-binding domain-containing protein n=1 Tax=Microdochium trichocladiopsis TaxID=1682393 RepID=A0A9P9BPW2_9PEZI|nr:uncharacterized protein B0I36DRAFT_250047 [Microdochium trichocladiopsis]KAH7024941.1 hypothetical protein B0I36DRAFT_250047 [Microdochium trichocladiopsis]